MERHQLEAFEAVAQAQNFTRAADLLCVTQPAVTRQIAALEAELKTRLFDRLGRTVRLTASGEGLHRYAGSILRLHREAHDALGDIEAGSAGRLSVGASSTLATYVLPPLLRRFREAHAGVELSIHTGISAHIIEMVRQGSVDVGLVTTDESDAAPDTRLAITPLADYDTCVVVPPGHALAKRGTVRAADLAGLPLLLMETGTNLRTYADRLLSEAGVAAPVAMELDNVEAIKRMIEAGLGVSLLPEVSVRAEVAAGRLYALPLWEGRKSVRRIALVQHPDKYLPIALRSFITLVRSEINRDG